MHRPPLAVGRFLRGVDKKQGGEREGTCGGSSNEGQWFDISPCHRHGVAPPALTATTTITAILHPVRRRVLISTGYAPSPGFFRRKLSRTVVDSMKPPRYPSSLHPFFPRAREIWRMERVVRGTRTLYNVTSIDHRGNRRPSTFWPSRSSLLSTSSILSLPLKTIVNDKIFAFFPTISSSLLIFFFSF